MDYFWKSVLDDPTLYKKVSPQLFTSLIFPSTTSSWRCTRRFVSTETCNLHKFVNVARTSEKIGHGGISEWGWRSKKKEKKVVEKRKREVLDRVQISFYDNPRARELKTELYILWPGGTKRHWVPRFGVRSSLFPCNPCFFFSLLFALGFRFSFHSHSDGSHFLAGLVLNPFTCVLGFFLLKIHPTLVEIYCNLIGSCMPLLKVEPLNAILSLLMLMD